MNKLEVKISWWYKPFIRFMPNFYKDVPPFKHGLPYKGGATLVGTFIGARNWKYGPIYNDNHHAYLSARWKALWIDFWHPGDDGVSWGVVRVGNEPTDLSRF